MQIKNKKKEKSPKKIHEIFERCISAIEFRMCRIKQIHSSTKNFKNDNKSRKVKYYKIGCHTRIV